MSPLSKMFGVCAALAAVASAQPHQNSARSSVETFTDNFDNITSIQPLLTFAGYQNDINYSTFQVAAVDATDGIKTVSPPNAAAIALTNPANANLLPSQTATKSGSLKYFNLISFYAGCLLDLGQALGSVSTGCVFVVSGYDIYGNAVPEATFGFAPATLEGAPMNFVLLPPTFAAASLVNFSIGVAAASVSVQDTGAFHIF